MADADDDRLIARLAVHFELLTREQVGEAMRRWRESGGPFDFATFLVAEDLLTAEAMRKLLVARDRYRERNEAASGATEPPAPAPAAPAPAIPAPAPAAAPEPVAAPAPAAPATAQPVVAASGLLGWTPESRLEDLLRAVRDAGASDLHVHAGAPVKVRLHGELQDASPVLDGEATAALLRPLLDELGLWERLEEDRQVDFSFAIPGVGRYRANAFRQHRGYDGVFRAISTKPPTLAELGMPEDLARLADFHQGIILFVGPAGCGKSSTMAAIVDLINRQRPDHILTIEDPIEYVHASRRCVVNQRQVGPHTGSFARALRAALREDPDIIVIGELRDLETISLALTAAETGHLVLGTLHTSSAIRTINRLLGVFPPAQQAQIRTMVSESLRAVVAQRLIPTADGQGRVPAIELMLNTKAIGSLIRDQKTFQIQSVMQTATQQGMRLLDASLTELVEAGKITREAAARQAEDAKRFAAAK